MNIKTKLVSNVLLVVVAIAAVVVASVSSLGTRTTVFGIEPLLEAHLFDFDGDLYGKRITVEFVAKLRDEEKFDDLPALIRQMDLDSLQAKKILQHDKNDKKDLGVSA